MFQKNEVYVITAIFQPWRLVKLVKVYDLQFIQSVDMFPHPHGQKQWLN